MPAPQGETLSFQVDGQEMHVQLEPTILSRKSQEALFRVYRNQVRQSTWQDMQELNANKDIDAITKEEIRQQYTDLLRRAASPSLENAISVFNTPDGMVAVLETSSNLTHEDAKKLVDAPGVFLKLVSAVSEVLLREQESIKNS